MECFDPQLECFDPQHEKGGAARFRAALLCRCSGWLILPLGPVFPLRFLVEKCFGYRTGLSMFWFSWIPCFSA